MRHAKEEPSCSTEQVIDLVSAVKELHQLSSQELNKLLKDSENFILQHLTEKGSSIQIDVEKLARFLPLHLIAVLMSSNKDEALFRYFLCGLRLLYSLCDLASRNTKLEQILLDDVKVSEQLLDLVFFLLIVLGGYQQENHVSSLAPLMHSALVACSLYLLTQCISPHWHELVPVLVAHPKVDIFMHVAFGAACVDIKFLQIKLSSQCTDICMKSSPSVVNYLCQQCEASLQFLQSLCQQKLFRERLLRNKELCGKGGVLLLARAVFKLSITPLFQESSTVVAAVSRMKSKVLFILLHLCEADSISFLDEVSSSPRSRDLAESVALEVIFDGYLSKTVCVGDILGGLQLHACHQPTVLELLKTAFSRDPRHLSACSDRTYPMGLLQLSALRLTDIFSDDSNFKSYITIHFTEVLTAIFSFPRGEFLSSWCSSILPVREEDATVEYDAFAAAGWVLDSFSSPDLLNATLNSSSMPQASYAHQRTSLLVKIIANLHCFVPKICKEHEKNLFLHKFLECLQMDPPKSSPGSSFASDSQKAATVCRNLRSLVGHAESLIPNFLSEDDVQLLRVFLNQLQSLTATDEFEVNRLQQIQESKFEGSVSWEKFSKLNIGEHHQEAQSTGGCSSPQLRRVSPNLNNINSNLKEGMSENSAFQEVDQYYVRSNHMDQTDDVMKRDRRKDKDKHGRVTSGGLRETEGDFQNVESSGSDTSSTRGKNSNEQVDNSEFPKSSEHIIESGSGGVHEDEKVENIHCEEKQRRKRKRTIMNDKQMTLIERALLEEPDMQRNAASIQSWADKLSVHGSEVTSSQLKNWLNNRKARLARAAKDVRAMSEGENAFPDKQGGSGGGSFYDSPESPGEDLNVPLTARGTRSASENSEIALAELADVSPAEFVQCEPGQYVVLVNGQGEEIGTGKVYQVQGKWYGRSLEESGTAVVDVIELKVERWVKLPHPSEATGTSFDEAEIKIGAMRVLWDSSKIFMLQSQ